MDKTQPHFTTADLREIYAAAWEVGACNPRGMRNALPEIVKKCQYEIDHDEFMGIQEIRQSVKTVEQHPCYRLFIGHINFLEGKGLGPDAQDAERVKNMLDMSEAADNLVKQ